MDEALKMKNVISATHGGIEMRVIKTPGPEYVGGPMRGHCYDGTGWVECSFWKHGEKAEESRCMLFGAPDGVPKYASEALRICDKLFGVYYDGEI
ncbi:MAG: hypothetical protein RBT11_19150 [Desulfobacterales bacterium]|jgi:hypothetical protein|nr:hypothetical protein [Desulfobacterales bacterium]